MGLQKNITLSNGINLPEAYIKIRSFSVVPNESLDVSVSIYKDLSARESGKMSVTEFQHSCTKNEYFQYFTEDIEKELGKTIISQVYLWLKTLPFYESAVDVNVPVKE